MLSPDGACKSFDASGNGYCHSECAVAIYLTKSSEAKRIYAHVVNSKANSDGYKTQSEDKILLQYHKRHFKNPLIIIGDGNVIDHCTYVIIIIVCKPLVGYGRRLKWNTI